MTVPTNAIFFCGGAADKIWELSGRFTTTIRDSLDVNAAELETNIHGVEYAGSNNVWWIGSTLNKIYNNSRLTTTVRTSLDVSAIVGSALDISEDQTNTWVVDNTGDKFRIFSGKVSSTIKNSLGVNAIDTSPNGLCCIGPVNNFYWTGGTDIKVYQQSLFTSVLKFSLAVTSIESGITGVTWTGVNLVIVGTTNDKLYELTGTTGVVLDSYATSGVSETAPRGVSVEDYFDRLGLSPDTQKPGDLDGGAVFEGGASIRRKIAMRAY